jgi:hypothetical protein
VIFRYDNRAFDRLPPMEAAGRTNQDPETLPPLVYLWWGG